MNIEHIQTYIENTAKKNQTTFILTTYDALWHFCLYYILFYFI